jgi:hypothetical protein
MAGVNEPVGFTEKSWLKVLFADLLWEKNTVPTEKTRWKVRIIRQANRAKWIRLHRLGISKFDLMDVISWNAFDIYVPFLPPRTWLQWMGYCCSCEILALFVLLLMISHCFRLLVCILIRYKTSILKCLTIWWCPQGENV